MKVIAIIGTILVILFIITSAYLLYIGWKQDEYCRKKFGKKYGFETMLGRNFCVANDGMFHVINE